MDDITLWMILAPIGGSLIGAFGGALLAFWFNRQLAHQQHSHSLQEEHERARYERRRIVFQQRLDAIHKFVAHIDEECRAIKINHGTNQDVNAFFGKILTTNAFLPPALSQLTLDSIKEINAVQKSFLAGGSKPAFESGVDAVLINVSLKCCAILDEVEHTGEWPEPK